MYLKYHLFWHSDTSDSNKYDPDAFLFSLANTANVPPIKLLQMDTDGLSPYSIYDHKYYGLLFGLLGNDLTIDRDLSESSFGVTYHIPPNQNSEFLAGIFYFAPSEVEICYKTIQS